MIDHSASQHATIAPVTRNADRHPKRSAIGVTISGVTMPPSEPPLYPMAVPRDCRFGGNDSAAAFKAAGKAEPSPKPSTLRATANPQKPDIQACAVLAMARNETAANIPLRRPTKSRNEPKTGFPIMYKMENAASACA